MPKPICVIGCWHQGVVGAACLASLGYDVTGVDADAARVAALNAGRAPLFEPGLDDLLRRQIDAGRLRFSGDTAGSVRGRRLVCIMFDTPVDADDQSDLSCVFQAARELAPSLEPGAVIWVTAQVPVGTCDQLAAAIREIRRDATFSIAYSPENLRLGQAIERFLKPPLPVMGSDSAEALDALDKWLAPMGAQWRRVNLRTAEMTKHALNAFLATSITFANELGNLCDEVGADGHRLAEVLRLEPRVGPKAMLFPGLGFAGGTLARDLQTLRGLGDRAGIETQLLDGVWGSNQEQNRTVVRRLARTLGNLSGRRVAVLGLTYKPDTSTLRRSAALDVIRDLAAVGAVVRAHDPKADREELRQHTGFDFHENAQEAIEGSEAVVLMTPWREYRDLPWETMRPTMKRPLVFDTANLLDTDRLMKAGYEVLDIGRGRRPSGPVA